MKVSEILDQRQPLWNELEMLCDRIGGSSKGAQLSAAKVTRFSTLYRSACADLALAEAWQFPPKTVDYLHRLVARAHSQMYRAERYRWKTWSEKVFIDVPAAIFQVTAVHVAVIVFWVLFFASAILAMDDQIWKGFDEDVLGSEQISQLESGFEKFSGRSWGENNFMAGFYILNNGSIGLYCFVMMLFIVPGFITLGKNAVALGASFGVMLRGDSVTASENFFNFVTAHGPLELTAIVLSAGAGLKIGVSWWYTNGNRRIDNLKKTAIETIPVAMCAFCLFVMAAFVEGFISPHVKENVPWFFKAAVAVITSGMLMFYFVVLGYPRSILGGYFDRGDQ